MKEIPLLFSTPMVQALLAGRKSQTRRIAAVPVGDHHGIDIMDWHLSKHPYQENGKWLYSVQSDVDDHNTFELKPKYGQVGNLFWVRETWAPDLAGDDVHSYVEHIRYVADNTRLPIKWVKDYWSYRNRPGIHMNKEYARIWLKKTATKVERACNISREDAIAEGLACISKDGGRTYKYGIPDRDGLPGNDDHGWPWKEWEVDPIEAFKKLWCKINGAETWNSWMWVNSFDVLSTTGKPELVNEKVNNE